MPLDYQVYENKAANRLIEEFMLLANMCVAKQLMDYFPELAFLRCHEAPNSRMLKELRNNLKQLDMDINIESAALIHSSMMKYGADHSYEGT